MNASTEVSALRGIGEAKAKLLAKLDIRTVGDLLRHFPRGYEDRSRIAGIAELQDGETACFRGTLCGSAAVIRSRGGRVFTRATVSDDTGVAELTFFNSPYVKDSLRDGESFIFYGTVQRQGRRVSVVNPVFDPLDRAGTVTGRPVPLYPLTAQLSNKLLSRVIQSALPVADTLPDRLPEWVRTEYDLLPYADALRAVHAPESMADVDPARRRLAFEELFFLSAALSSRRYVPQTPTDPLPTCDLAPFEQALPFPLTGAQKRCIREALTDMADGSRPMRRLIQGDVGSGKTAVAAACAYAAAQNGWQTVLMAPTEILAEQHFRSLDELLSPLGVEVSLLTASLRAPTRRAVLEELAEGHTKLLVATHAVLTDSVVFDALHLVITDEQHRFGVEQRTKLARKGLNPHMLVMSATPIPRTLALVIYGDLDISALDELPPGRIPVETIAVTDKQREKVYGFMEKLFLEGRQGYVVCPHIEDGENDAIRSVESHAEELTEVFPDFRVAALHGRVAARERDAIMRDFVDGKIQLLVSTTVIEVGVNVPNAAIMVIENAERFGLSQMHQLRGRVGRGSHRSYCVLFSQNTGGDTRARLDALCRTNDGFKLAQEDLRLRGPGDFFGVRQSGVPGLQASTLGVDMTLLSQAQDAAKKLLADDPELEKPENAIVGAYVRELMEKAAGTS